MDPIWNIFNHIIPEYCALCDRPGVPICSCCMRKLSRNLPQCYLCGSINTGFRSHESCLSLQDGFQFKRVYSCWKLERESIKTLRKIKRMMLSRTMRYLAKICSEYIHRSPMVDLIKGAEIVPAPPSDKESKRSGVDFSKVIAEEISKEVKATKARSNKVVVVTDRIGKNGKLEEFAKGIAERETYVLSLFSSRKPALFDKIRNVNPI